MLRVWLWAGQRVGFRLRLTAARRLAAALAQSEARTEGRASSQRCVQRVKESSDFVQLPKSGNEF